MKDKPVKHKITVEIQDRIAIINARLPPMGKMNGPHPVYKTVEVKGEQLRPDDLKEGQPLIPNAMYKVRRLVYENHAMNMIALVQKDGPEAIDKYEEAVMAQLNLWKENERREKSIGNRIIKLLLKLPWIKRKTL